MKGNFMKEMPEMIYGGSQIWEFHKFEEDQIISRRDPKTGQRVTSRKPVFKFYAKTREAKTALKNTLAGYKILWNASEDAAEFHDKVEKLRHGDLLPSEDKGGFSPAEKIGLAGDYRVRDRYTEEGWGFYDKYDFGNY